MRRREFLLLATAGAAAPVLFAGPARAASAPGMAAIEAMRRDWRRFLPASFEAPAPTDKLVLTDAEWRKRLGPARYRVLREDGTERAGTSPLNAEKRPGAYVCAGCALPLFTSEMKYESGTGWPSFFTTIPGVFGTKRDFLLIVPRTEYHCLRCGGHHGHVFDDGPRPTGQRWCNNGLALNFVPRDAG